MAATATMTAPITKRQQYEQLRASLMKERTSFEPTWREIAEFVDPMRPRWTVTDRNRGDRRNKKIIDSTATFARQTLASGLHAGMTSPARPWLNLSTPNVKLKDSALVAAWLHDVTEIYDAVFHLSNLYTALPTIYGDLATFGVAAMGVLDDPGSPGKPGDLFRCYPYAIGSYAIGIDSRGLVDTWVYDYSLKVGQLVDDFGGPDGQARQGRDPDLSRFSPTVQQLWKNQTYEQVIEVCWVVQPNRTRDTTRLGAAAMPFTSSHFERGAPHDTVLRESGYHEFPVLVPRWSRGDGDIYGTNCPGMTALGDIKALQIMQTKKAQAIAKIVDPPLTGSSALKNQAISSLPGGVTFDDTREGMKGLRPIFEVRPDISALIEDIREVQYRIKVAFYVDVIQMMGFSDPQRGAQPVTAREVEERHEEKLLAFGPVLESLIDELLDPLTDRVFGLMQRAGLVPDPPQELADTEFTVEYISIMAQAQKLVGITSLDRFAQSVAAISASDPGARHKVIWSGMVNEYRDKLGVNPKLIRSDEDAQQIADAEAKQAQAAQQAESFNKTATGAAALGNTPMGHDSALDRVVSGVTG